MSIPPGALPNVLDVSRINATQLQGDLVTGGLWLIEIPNYMLVGNVLMGYQPKPGWDLEVPFGDRLSIVRFVGPGCPPHETTQSQIEAIDYVQGSPGSLTYETEQMLNRLYPYLPESLGGDGAAYYRPQDFVLDVTNVPFAIAAGGGQIGTWGQMNPPDSNTDWANMLAQLASDLKTAFPNDAAKFRFKVGEEYDSAGSFSGTAAQLEQMFNTSAVMLKSGLSPHTLVTPGDFTGTGTGGVYSTPSLLAQAAAAGTWPAVIPRSLNYYQYHASYFPSDAVTGAVESYAGLGVIPRMDQFGLLGMPTAFNSSNGNQDQGAIRANWEFQAILGLIQQLNPERICHWEPWDQEGGLLLLNGIGHVRQVLNRYARSYVYPLYQLVHGAGATEVMAVGFYNAQTGAVAIVLSSFTPTAPTQIETPAITIPAGLIPGSNLNGWNIARYGPSNTFFAAMQADLASSTPSNLNSVFAANAQYQDSATHMAASSSFPAGSTWPTVSAMLSARGSYYESLIQQTLNPEPLQVSDEISYSSDTLTATIPPNELIVLEYGDW